MHNGEYLNPEVLTGFINFSRKNSQWKYTEDSNTMEKKQAEGASTLWNIMADEGVAILADEVGMGKTIQALSVCAALWRKNPSARILVFAPREAVAQNWANEYKAFISTHYREYDDRVKTSVEGKPVHEPILCKDIYDLCESVHNGWGRFFIAKTTSFSFLLSSLARKQEKGKLEVLRSKFDSIGVRINKGDGIHKLEKEKMLQVITEYLRDNLIENNLKFDLLIIDEAHYYRNFNGGSMRVMAAKSFFGKGENALASKVLLLTATPNHSSPDNVKGMISYFHDDLPNNAPGEILDKIAVRRYRTLGDKGMIKYNYRNESAVAARFSDDPKSELFYALYQKKLVQGRTAGINGKGNLQQGRMFYGYMEGFEFIPQEKEISIISDENGDEIEKDGETAVDFIESDDSIILKKLVKGYNSIYGAESTPSHPKYDMTVNDVIPGAGDDYWNEKSIAGKKSLVFVRRIPSINEISRRVMQEYDRILWCRIAEMLGVKEKDVPDREKYLRYFKKNFSEEENEIEPDDIEPKDVETIDSGIPTSKVFELFSMQRVAKGEKVKNTHAALFRRRFSDIKNLFSIFFCVGPEPGDTIEELIKPYILNTLYRKKGIPDYSLTAGLARTDYYRKMNSASARILENISFSFNSSDTEETPVKAADNFDTIWTIFWKLAVKRGEESDLLLCWKEFSIFERESLGQFLLKGVLFASPSLIELYVWFIETERESEETGRDFYSAFTEKVSAKLEGSRLYLKIVETIKHFKVFHEKILCVSDHELIEEQWRFFEQTMPVYPYSGSTKNKSILNAFNTPFYPDVLIATSVLQEGVNLQYFCKKVIHYGIAWTAGDNEQRVGRVDRMFGLVERELNVKDDSTLEIRYPFIEGSLDEDQLGLFLKKKHEAENLMDKCLQQRFSKEYTSEEISPDTIDKYLRKPEKGATYPDPYRAQKNRYSQAFEIKRPYGAISCVIKKIQGVFHSLGVKTYDVWDENHRSRLISILDARTEDGRNQPVLVELHFEPEFSIQHGEIVYVLSIKTPLCSAESSNIELIEKKYSVIRKNFDMYPGVQLAMDDRGDSSWRYKIYTRVSLPLFRDVESEGFLHSEEINVSLKNLIQCTDNIEKELFPDQDITLEDIKRDSEQHIPADVKMVDHVTETERGTGSDANWKGKWKEQGDHVKLYQHKSNEQLDTTYAMEMCHSYPFISFFRFRNGIVAELAYLKKDFQERERKVLESWFEYVMKLEW